MISTEISSSLPTSRTDALSVVLINLFSAAVGKMPGEDRPIGILVTTIANIWAIASSVLTFRDITNSSSAIETNLGHFLLGMLVLTIATSVVALISLPSKKVDALIQFQLIAGMVVVLAGFIFGLIELVMAYTQDCDDPSFSSSAFCNHSQGYVVFAVVGAAVVGLIGGFLIVYRCRKAHTKVDSNFVELPDVRNNSPGTYPGTTLNCTSALAKAVLLGVYWFLVDADLSWDYTINGYEVDWWVTGQWAKHGVAIINGLVECLC